jgi:DNA-binding NtrC family response regulator
MARTFDRTPGGSPFKKPKLLIIDDDEIKTALLHDYDVLLAGDRAAAVTLFKREKPPVVILDLSLRGRSHEGDEGLSTLRDILAEETAAKVIVITTQEERRCALDAIARGAYEFFTKPIDIDALKVAIRRALYTEELEKESRELRQRLSRQAALGSETQQLRQEGESLRAARERLERSLIQDALAKHTGNVTRAAEDLGVSRPTLYELIYKLGIPRR